MMEKQKSTAAGDTPAAEAETDIRAHGSPISDCRDARPNATRWLGGDDGDGRDESSASGLPVSGYLCIAPDVKLGKDVKLAKFISLYGCEVGDETKIGAFVEVQKNAKIGRRCKISSHTFICEGVTIEDHVFIGHGVTFINDSYPRATTPMGEIQTEKDWKIETTLVRKGASIGSGATILSNVVIGENAIVGAGSVVTKDVTPFSVVAGNPAKVLKVLPREG